MLDFIVAKQQAQVNSKSGTRIAKAFMAKTPLRIPNAKKLTILRKVKTVNERFFAQMQK